MIPYTIYGGVKNIMKYRNKDKEDKNLITSDSDGLTITER